MGLKKRGGISVYIIIAVAIFLISILIFSLYDQGDQFKKDVLPPELRDHQVIYFVDECIKDTTFNGIKQLSLQSGHLNPYPDSPNPMSSSGVYLTDIFIPYWYYVDENQLKSRMPPLYKRDGPDSIEQQLSNYIIENLPSCINNFENFKDQYLIEEEEFKIDILIRERDLQINVLYPMRIISLSDNSQRFENNFNTRLNVPLKEIYTFAKKITEKQIEMNLIEQHILNVISLYSGIDEPLPPMSGLTIGSNDLRYWTRSGVEEIIKDDVLEFIRLIQIMNAKNFNPIVYADESAINSLKQGIYGSMVFKVDDVLYENIEANFLYPSSDIYLNIGGNELIMPENRIPMRNFITDLLRIIIYDYSFEYDLTFPIIASLKAENVHKGQDLIFRFGMQANIRNNLPLNQELGLDFVEFQPNYEFSNPETFVYNPVYIQTIDKDIGFTIDNVSIFYNCGQEVFIDTTYFGYVYDFLPFCLGGKIIATHPNYANVIYPYDNLDTSDEDIILEMKPIREIEVEVRKIELSNINLFTQPLSPMYSRKDLIYQNSKPLDENERVLITLNNIKEFDEEQDIPFRGFLEIKSSPEIDYVENIRKQVEEQFSDGKITLQERDEILAELSGIEFESFEMDNIFELIEGNYTYNAFLFYENDVIIPEKISTFCPCLEVWGICGCSEETIILPEMKFPSLPIGGAEANITISNDLYNSEKIIFYVFVNEVPLTWDDFEELKQTEDFEEYNFLLNPYLITIED